MRDNRQNNSADQQEPKQFEEKLISVDRVARVVKGGRRFRFKTLVVVGDKKVKVGVGVSKGADVQAAAAKAAEVAKRNMITIDISSGTIIHETDAKVGGADILLKPAPLGTGIIAGGTVRAVMEAAGIQNVVSKSLGSSNKLTALMQPLKRY